MVGSQLLVAALFVLVVGAIITTVIAKHRKLCGYVAFVTALIAAICVSTVAWQALTTGPVVARPVVTITELGSSLVFVVDQLSAVFLLITALMMVCTTLFSIRYILIYKHYSLARYYPLLLLFFSSVISVLSVHNMLFFLHFWEFMTLTSYVLVVFHWVNPDAGPAGLRYFIATHVAMVCMLVATIILYRHAGSFEFAAMREALAELTVTSPATVHLILGLFVVGFATKAGILPFGFWMPDAYPAAPTAASAAFVGTMCKLGVYGIIRVFTAFLPLSHFVTTWGIIIAALGTISIFVGTITALQQTDSKRLLTFHAIGQTGYMYLAIGVGLALLRISPPLATVALLAGLFHVVNNALFKPLLFMNAGAALYRTGTRDMDKAGGLMQIMPVTAITAIIASLAIAGIPGLNGFASKWLIFVSSIMAGFDMPLLVFLGIIAIFISAVTLASFLKFLGMLFVGKLHIGPEVERREVPTSMVIPQVVLAIFCVLFGVLPILVLRHLYTAVSAILPAGYSPTFASLFGTSSLTVDLSLSGMRTGAWGPVVVVVAFGGCLALAYLIFRMGGAQTRKVPMWLCGEEHDFAEVRYPVHSFLLTFNRYFAKIYPSIPFGKLARPTAMLRLFDIDRWVYEPVLRALGWVMQGVSASHTGLPQLYMLWVVVGAALAVIVLFSMGGGL